ncbi:MAG: hypothetical protein QOJ12_2842, partial [Thermoleophilales bacterium]|nr:hypothetical protein [Thermoleophilales bacterium]
GKATPKGNGKPAPGGSSGGGTGAGAIPGSPTPGKPVIPPKTGSGGNG